MGERTKSVRENAKKHGIIGEKMTETERKFYQNSSKSWLSVVRSMETRGKKQLLPSNGNLYHYAGNNPVCYTDPDGKFSIRYDTDGDLLATYKSFTMMMAIPLGGGLTSDQEKIRKLINIGNAALGFTKLSDYNVFSFSEDPKQVAADSAKALIGPSLSLLKTMGPKIAKVASGIGNVLTVCDFAKALFSTPEMDPKNYTKDAQSLLLMTAIEQSFANDFCKELDKQNIAYSINYTDYSNSFISNISIMGDWAEPMEQLRQVFDAVKNSKPDLYRSVKFEN